MGQINPEASSFTCMNDVKSNLGDCCYFSGGYSANFYTGRLRPEVQPLTILYTIFDRKVPFRIPPINKWYLFHTLV